MILDEQRKKQILGVFKAVYDLRDQAKELTATATENMKGLAESLETNPEACKNLKKSLDKAYKEYVADKEGQPDTLEDALTIIEAVCTKVA